MLDTFRQEAIAESEEVLKSQPVVNV